MNDFDSLMEIKDGILNLNEIMIKRVSSYSEMNINKKENLESLQASLIDIKKYIEVLKENIENEESIFYVGIGSNENQRKLDENEELKENLENHIKSLQESIKSELEEIQFLKNISSDLLNYYNLISNILDDNENNSSEIVMDENNSQIKETEIDKSDLLTRLKRCQKFSMVDYERCYIELGKIIEEVELWEEN